MQSPFSSKPGVRGYFAAGCMVLAGLGLLLTGSHADHWKSSQSTTIHYVRPDGGSSEQCTGLVNAPYPGSGMGQPCAWDHPFRAFPPGGTPRIAGGDTLIIEAGSYMMGYGAPEDDNCDSYYPWDCYVPPIPSGPDPSNPTRILGEGWDTGCSNPPELWGAERTNMILNLTDANNVELACLEITDHSGCVEFHTGGLACKRDSYPFGLWAADGLYAEDSANVHLRDLNIHGLAAAGVRAGRLTDWTVEDVRIAGNGWVGWDGDIYDDDANSGTLLFRRWTVEWNGCGETWPDEEPTSECDTTCDGSELVLVRNNIFQGHPDFLQPYENTCLTWTGGFPHDPFDIDYSVINDAKHDPCPGPHDICGVSPCLANLSVDAFDAHLLPDSPAIDAGTVSGAPAVDFDGNPRPLDGDADGIAVADIGADEFALFGDLNYDCDVDVMDTMLVASRWNSSAGDPNYEARYDIDGDGDMDVVDIMLVAACWGETCETGLDKWALWTEGTQLPVGSAGRQLRQRLPSRPVLSQQGVQAVPGSSPPIYQHDNLAGREHRPLYVPGQLIIKFKKNVPMNMRGQALAANQMALVKALLLPGYTLVEFDQAKDVRLMAASLLDDPSIESAEPNYYRYADFTPNDTYYSYQWHFPMIQMPPAWEKSNGAGVTVAVIDTGVAYENYGPYRQAPDLAGTAFVAGWDFVNGDSHANDDDSHGTHVAGTIAQTTNNGMGVTGIAYGANIMPVKVLDSQGSGTDQGVADGIVWAVNHGAQVINLSLGGPTPSGVLESAVNHAYSNGGTVVAAAGNDNSDIGYPAAYENCIAVGAVRYDESRAHYSNYGPALDLVAPGGDVHVDQNGDEYGDGVLQQTFDPYTQDYADFGYWFLQGTSMATPHVSGVAALLVAHGNATTPDEVRAALESTAKDEGPAGWDVEYGHGLIQANDALDYEATPITETNPLDQGWNLISLPLEPDDPVPDVVLSSVAGQYDQVYAYDGCDPTDQWKQFVPGGGDNDLTTMDIRYGYWIHATSSVTFTITGTQPTTTNIPLCSGWNLIGWPSSQSVTLPDALSSIADDYDLVYGYDPTDTADPWKRYDPTAPAFANDLAELEPGKGYWVQASTVCTLTVTR